MAITNGYITLVNFKALLNISSTDATDDGVIERMIEQASRFFDAETGRTFYARTDTRYFSVPEGRELRMDDDLLSITTLTNGDDTVLAATEYNLVPKNSTPYYAIKLKQGSVYYWSWDGSNTEDVISVAGTWGFSATAPMDVQQAVEDIAKRMYNRREGTNEEGQVKVTSAGVVVTPRYFNADTENHQPIQEARMTLQIAAVANAIAAISVTGVTIHDIDEIKEAPGIRDTPCLMPKPDGYITDFEVTRDSYGAASKAKRTVTYTLNYTLMYAPIGSGRGLFDVYDGMVGKAFAVIDAIMAQDATVVPLIEAGEPSQFGPVVDPAGNAYHGCIISVNVTEFVN